MGESVKNIPFPLCRNRKYHGFFIFLMEEEEKYISCVLIIITNWMAVCYDKLLNFANFSFNAHPLPNTAFSEPPFSIFIHFACMIIHSLHLQGPPLIACPDYLCTTSSDGVHKWGDKMCTTYGGGCAHPPKSLCTRSAALVHTRGRGCSSGIGCLCKIMQIPLFHEMPLTD